MSENRTVLAVVVALAGPNALPLRRGVAAPVPATAPGRAVRTVGRDRVEAWVGDGSGATAAGAAPAGELAPRTRAAHCRIAVQYLD
ncbi:hypothetical protein ACF9IK_29285 [Kitasatospora hibisci]|uniref:hypothetical protein n=1 Tax=Kitasatospora hibisci TaxID=3369522 RepID=UPI0037553B33